MGDERSRVSRSLELCGHARTLNDCYRRPEKNKSLYVSWDCTVESPNAV